MIDVPAPGDGGPSDARIYDYFLGGAHNFAQDREQAKAIIAALPGIVPAAWANRSFLRHAVESALRLGIDQFLDLGSGIPTVGNVHEIVHRHDPAARVAYVDNDPTVLGHGATLLAELPTVTMTDADLREPATVLAAPGVADLLDLDRPVALTAIAALHWIEVDEDVVRVLDGYRRALAPGSIVALTQVSGSSDGPGDGLAARHDYREAVRLYRGPTNPSFPRSPAVLRSIVEAAGFRADADGVVDIGRWAPGSHPRGEPVESLGVITEPLPRP